MKGENNMIKVKPNINWYKWVRENLRDPEYASDSAPYVVAEALDVCRSRRELAIALWAVLDLPTLMSVETVEKKLEEVIEEVADDA